MCRKPSHYDKDCEFKKNKNLEVNLLEENDDIIVIMSKINAIQGNVSSWWYGTFAIVHICYDKSIFKNYEQIEDKQEVQMGNEGRPKVFDKGNV